MRALKIYFVSGMLLMSVFLQAQVTGNPEIQKKLDAYIELTNQKQWSQAFDLLYPKMFSKIPKQDLIDLVEAEEMNGLSLHLSNRRITAFSAPFVDGNETFVRVSYTADMKVAVAPGGIYDYQKSIMGMQQQFESTYGENNVKWNPESKEFTIQAHKAMIAVQEPGKDWYLVEVNPEQKALMESLFSEAVLNALIRVE